MFRENAALLLFDHADRSGTGNSSHLLDELTTHAYRPFEADADPRPLPEPQAVDAGVDGAMDAIADMLADTRLEDDVPDVLWSLVNVFHRRAEWVGRQLDDNEQAQRRAQAEQDGSEIRSVELERLIALGLSSVERRNAFEYARDRAAEFFHVHTGSTWRPRSGSKVNRKALTAAMIDSRDFIAAKRRSETEIMLPPGSRVAFTGGADYQDVERIWTVLDKVKAKHSTMVLLHGGGQKGAELIASKWADTRKVPQIAFRPDWNRHKHAAPFKRNDAMLETLPIGVIAFPGNGINENLCDKARAMGIPVSKHPTAAGG